MSITKTHHNKLVSIIIPTYNVQKYVDECIGSLLKQRYYNIELIIIDDGSTDRTQDIIKQYADIDERVLFVEQKHRGPNIARKKGVKLAHGDYIMFVDADDYIEDNAVERLVDTFSKNDVDAIKFNIRYTDSREIICQMPESYGTIIDHDQIFLLLSTTNCLNSLCSQIYKADLVKNIKSFNLCLTYGEDLLVNSEIHQRTKKLMVLDDCLYNYRNNPDSTTHIEDRNRILRNIADRIFVSHRIITLIKKDIDNYDSIRMGIRYQIKSIGKSIASVSKIKGYTKKDFLKDFKDILPEKEFLEESDILKSKIYVEKIGIRENIKNQKIIKAIILSDYDYIWKYINLYKIYYRIIEGLR